MLINNMLKISTNKSIFIITVIFLISSQSTIASPKISKIKNIKSLDWEHAEVFLYSHGYGNDLRINNQSILQTCFVKDVKLYIYYQMPIWPLFPNFKIWNNTGLIIDFIVDFCSFHASNFTGLIIYRISWLGNFWHIIGYCQYFKIRTGYC
jgi:uncharacterized protein (DUF779 family)